MWNFNFEGIPSSIVIIDLYFKDPAAWRTGGHPDGEDRWRLVELGQWEQQGVAHYELHCGIKIVLKEKWQKQPCQNNKNVCTNICIIIAQYFEVER